MKRLAQVIPLAKSDKSGCLCGGMLVYRMHGLRDVGRLSAKLLQSLQTVVTSQVERDFPIVRGAPLAGGHSVSRSDCGFLMREWNSVPQQAAGVSHLLSQVCSGRRWDSDDRVANF